MESGDAVTIAPTSPIFAVYYPDDIKNSPRVLYQSVKDATKFANSPESRSKGARFRRFGNASEATEFFERGDIPVTSTRSDNSAAASDPVVNFASVTRIEMNKLKKLIEMDSLDEFRDLTELNPRYLINTSGDTASIVQEGFRFNSLHIAARNGSALVADHILKRISNTEYLIMLYGTNEVDANFRKENILVSYLNTPDKGNGDTPLHLSSKWGHVEVARIISSYRQTIKDFKNKNNEIPLDVVCSRYNGEKKEEVAKQLRTILYSFYVAIYRCSDNCLPPRWIISCHYPQRYLPSTQSSLHSPFSPILAPFLVTAVVGPFQTEENAIEFQRRWKGQGLDRRRKDFDRGAEKVGREMAEEGKVEWAESWPFYDQPINVKSNYGLELMEKYLKKKMVLDDEKREKSNEIVELRKAGVEKCEEMEEDEYEDAREEWNDDSSPLDSWSEDDSLGSLYSKMESLSMSDESVLEWTKRNEVAVDEEEDMDSFVTPPSSPPPLFLDHSPSKVDTDLYEVLSSLDESKMRQYPLIKRFISSMHGLEGSTRSSLPSHTSPRYWDNSPRSRINKQIPRRNMLAQLNDLP